MFKSSLIKAFFAIAAVFAPTFEVLTGVYTLLAADFITGTLAAKKRKEKITSAGMHRSTVKFVVYTAAILLAYVAEHFILKDKIPIMNIASGFAGLTQLTSVYENLNELSGGKLLKDVIAKLKSKNDDL